MRSLLEILAHSGGRLKLPGPHHCARALIPADVAIETLDEAAYPGWEAVESGVAREVGDAWVAGGRTAVLSVPATTARPQGRHLLLNPAHADYASIEIEAPVAFVWDLRLLRV